MEECIQPHSCKCVWNCFVIHGSYLCTFLSDRRMASYNFQASSGPALPTSRPTSNCWPSGLSNNGLECDCSTRCCNEAPPWVADTFDNFENIIKTEYTSNTMCEQILLLTFNAFKSEYDELQSIWIVPCVLILCLSMYESLLQVLFRSEFNIISSNETNLETSHLKPYVDKIGGNFRILCLFVFRM